MKEYIDKDAALEAIFQNALDPHAAYQAVRKIKPISDLRPEKSGKWIVGKSKWSESLNSYTCPFCGGSFQNPDPLNFCGDCGADMREAAPDAGTSEGGRTKMT